MPDLDDAAGFGSGITQIAADAGSQYLFFIHQIGLLKCNTWAGSLAVVDSGNISSLVIYDSYLFYIENGNQLHWGTIDLSDGAFNDDIANGSPLTLSAGGSLHVNPFNNQVYLFQSGTTPAMYSSSDTYDAFTSGTTFSSLGTTGLSTSFDWITFGIAPDGRLFLGTTNGANKSIAYSDDETNWTTVATGIVGVMGPNFAFAGTSASYETYSSTMGSSDGGTTWEYMPRGGTFETHANDGPVAVDPNDSAVVYMTTDQGIGASYNSAHDIFEIDDGVEAVQVNDFDMDASKNYAWVASKAGVRSLTGYQTSPSWSLAMFPNGDGSPYYSTDMDPSDTSGQTAYVGNARVYKTTNRGSTWEQVFTAENAPYNFSAPPVRIASIEVNQYKTSQVFAGYNADDMSEGGLFYSDSSGALGTWDQILIQSGSVGNDVDVNDILVLTEGSDTVVYIGVQYDLSSPAGWSVYRITRSGATWSATQDMSSSNTSTGTNIIVTIRDLAVNATGDTIYAVGTDAGTNHPVAYYKPVGGLWTVMPLNGFPMSINAEGRAVTVGNDTVFVAVGSDVYLIPEGGTSWTIGYSYPVGTQINVLYFDELLIGTSTGLYGHQVVPGPPATFSVNRGWNLVSMPMDLPNTEKSFVFPTSSTLAYSFSEGGGYSDEDTLEYGVGYWLKFGNPQGIVMSGTPRISDTVDLKAGWNLIGTVSGAVPVGSIIEEPAELVESQFFGYNYGYYTTDALEQGKGYWVKASQDGELMLNSTLASSKLMDSRDEYKKLNSLTITDANGNKQTLYFGTGSSTGLTQITVKDYNGFELPPVPPLGIFDVRFASNKFVELNNKQAVKNVPINISSAQYPLQVQWNILDGTNPELVVDGKARKLANGGSTMITNSASSVGLRLTLNDNAKLPKQFSLNQNYPNPFNPTTTFGFQIANQGFVTLKIYDLLGKEVASLVNENMNPGSYSKVWDAGGIPSGMYYYRLQASGFSESKKLLIVK
ncbi:MAG: T9SS type A sorting domain-containing protein [Bacteroidetes bacterium]|nr:MAG: T9SS type A sorting domain-containing protein [Bacteroidota bacterium]